VCSSDLGKKDVGVIAPCNIDELSVHLRQEVGVSRWQTMTQDDVDRFPDATGDHQWIHTDGARARQTEFGDDRAQALHALAGAELLAELASFEHFALRPELRAQSRALRQPAAGRRPGSHAGAPGRRRPTRAASA